MHVDELKARREQLVAYMLSKVKAKDWHAVQDAASDIRELEAQLEVLKLVKLDFVPEGD